MEQLSTSIVELGLEVKYSNCFRFTLETVMAGQMDMGAILGEQLLNAAKVMEEQVDQQIANLDNMDEDELEVIKRRRIGKELFCSKVS